MSLKISNKTQDILSYESDVWASADVLRSSVGLKNSEFPDFMMPFFALRMVESRLIRKYDEVSKDPELVSLEDRIAEIKETVGFYNSMVIEESTTLSDIVLNDKNFHIDFKKYLDSFDVGLKNLLGIDSPDKTENLNLHLFRGLHPNSSRILQMAISGDVGEIWPGRSFTIPSVCRARLI